MSEQRFIERARKWREGKAQSTQAGKFVHEEIEHIREGKHGARSTKQAIAIGLSKARRAGVKLKPPSTDRASANTRRKAQQDLKSGKTSAHESPPKRSRTTMQALQREGHSAASHQALSRHAKQVARRRALAK